MAPSIPFTPPHVSVNRVQVVDLPGIPLDDEVRDRKAHDLLSSVALVRYAQEEAEALGLPPTRFDPGRSVETRVELPQLVASCLEAADPQARSSARAVGRRLGRNLAFILLTLHRGDPVNRRARADWDDADWEHWAQIRCVWLGGGLMSGRLGELILQHARALLGQAGMGGRLGIAPTPYGEMIALLGAGRYLPPDTRQALCLDCGRTLVKRACLIFDQAGLAGMRRYPSLPVEWDWLGAPAQHAAPGNQVETAERGRRVLAFVAQAIGRTMAESRTEGLNPGPQAMLSVAAYVRDGQLLGNGLYAQMSHLSADVRPLLAEAVRSETGQAMQIHPIHDGTAAAAMHAGAPATAVILVGTALGVGFPPADGSHLRSVSGREITALVRGPT